MLTKMCTCIYRVKQNKEQLLKSNSFLISCNNNQYATNKISLHNYVLIIILNFPALNVTCGKFIFPSEHGVHCLLFRFKPMYFTGDWIGIGELAWFHILDWYCVHMLWNFDIYMMYGVKPLEYGQYKQLNSCFITYTRVCNMIQATLTKIL